MDTVVQLTASFITIAASWLYGNKSPWGPWLGLASQIPWNIVMIHGGLWGLAPVNAMMLVVHTRNLMKWRADARREAVEAAVLDAGTLQDHRRERQIADAYEALSRR